jgi:Tfp pilus assembly protein PilF
MSVLLDALKTSESSVAEIAEPQDEPLDAASTLELLSLKPTANVSLALEPVSDIAAVPTAAAAPELVRRIAPTPPIYARPALVLASPTSEPAAAPPPESAAPVNARGTVAAPPPARRTKRYGLLLATAVALVGTGMLGKSLFWPKVTAVTYPETTTPPVNDTATSASIHAVQVPSVRPPDQFAYSGDAPEIDLHDLEIRPVEPRHSTAPRGAARAVSPAAATATRAAPTPSGTATLSVARSEGVSPIDRHVQAGYRSLASGDFTTAQTEYLAALALDPNNVDALMGAATTAARGGKSIAAATGYARVLRLEPGNPDATAAMAMLASDGAASELNESRLKILIAGDDGNRPALHAALAGVYARDARWSDAAQEYFTALGKDPGNPDLAYNVAASLDQNRNRAMALAYYEQALAFARQRPAQIDLHAVERRITQLQARPEARASIALGAP